VFTWTVTNGVCSIAEDNVTITITPISDLELTKTVSSTSVNAGDVVTFTVSIFNNDASATNSDATGISVQDVLPLGYALVPGTVSNGGAFDLGTQTITWTNLAVTNGDTLNLTFNATVNASGPYVNTAQIIASDNLDPDSEPNNDDGDQSEDDEATATVTIESADLSLQKVVAPLNVSVGDVVVFTVTVANAGTDAATNVQVSDQLPTGYTYQSDDAAGNYNPATGIWNIGTVTTAINAELNITAVVNAPTGTANEYLNRAQIIASDQNDPDSDPTTDETVDEDGLDADGDGNGDDDDEDSATIILETADLQITKTVLPASGAVGDRVTFNILLENFGTGDATGIAIEDLLPSGFDLVPGTVSDSGVFIVGNKTQETIQIAFKLQRAIWKIQIVTLQQE
jgi:uncharacterized repeat protein (TIGR01451 family)